MAEKKDAGEQTDRETAGEKRGNGKSHSGRDAEKEMAHGGRERTAHMKTSESGIGKAKVQEPGGEGKPLRLEAGIAKIPELKEESRTDLENDLVRLQAEFENYRKRSEREMAERMEMGKMEFAKSQISFLDEFENALAHLNGEAKRGMEMLLSNFKKSLEVHGVREMECMGRKFDPYLHDVLMKQESGKSEGTVVAVARKGYMFRDKILRHAQVIIAAKKEEKNEARGVGKESKVDEGENSEKKNEPDGAERKKEN